MATSEEIQRRVEQADTARSVKRSAVAQQVGELAQRRAVLAGQLDDVERELGDVLAEASDVMDIDELARFTDIPAPDLTGWLTARKPLRTRRNKPSGGVQGGTSRGSAAARTTNGQTATPLPGRRADAIDVPHGGAGMTPLDRAVRTAVPNPPGPALT
ncbi:hypothetical protein [Saccharothrix texasensis]|uniref:hypothetical protein n=1 Tax=Saccharothrix texasensis TaxID=103734 RepID=UPI001B8668ED|nr:hypothetical protein [Saccharothrix texasensis]